MFLADDLVLSVKKRGSIPTSEGLFEEADFLRIADEEMQSYLVPFLQSIREDYYVTEVDLPFATSLRVPSRAVGGALREVVYLDAAGNVRNPPRASLDDPEGRGFKIVGSTIRYLGRDVPATARLSYYQRPNKLVRAAECARVTAIVGSTVTLGVIPPPTTPLSAPIVPAPDSFDGVTSFDVIRSTPLYEHVATDCTGTYSAGQIEFASAPEGVAVGDLVALAGYTPVVQAPEEVIPLLCQRVAAKCLETLGFVEEMNAALSILKRMESDAKVLLTPRVAGAPLTVVPRNALWRRR